MIEGYKFSTLADKNVKAIKENQVPMNSQGMTDGLIQSTGQGHASFDSDKIYRRCIQSLREEKSLGKKYIMPIIYLPGA